MTKTPHALILPSPGMGHLIPCIEFAKHIVHLHNFHITCIIPTIGSPPDAMIATLQALPSTINHIFLPPVSFEDAQEETDTTTLVAFAMTRSLPFLRDALKSLYANSSSHRFVAFLFDPFGIDALDVANEYNMLPYLFFPLSAMSLSLSFYMRKLDEMVSCEYRDHPESIRIPGCIPIRGTDLVEAVENRKSEVYKWFLDITKRFDLAKGVLVNTFMEMEAGALKAMAEDPIRPPIYPIGPLISSGSIDLSNGSGSDCLRWLENQPSGSVLFVLFGSGGTLTQAQLNELAFGLEMSEQRFLWVVKSPNDVSASATYFSLQSQQEPFGFLPNGFLEGTKERGLVIASWAPQAQILSHGSTGGFLTHCGWNSTLESVVNGVPIIAWPLFAEQKLNAVMLSEDIKLALRPKANENGLVMRAEIAKVVKELMEREEGQNICNRMKHLKDAAANAIKEDGSSMIALSKLAREWKDHLNN